MRKIAIALVAGSAVGALAALGGPAHAQAKTYELKIAHFVTPKHSYSIWLENWSKRMEKESNGELKFTIFPSAQMGPPPAYYDIVRRGRADIAWWAHGFTPGRFPLTEISNLPFLIGSAEIGTKVMNDTELRAKYLDPEHRGVKVLMLLTHQPGNIHTHAKPIRTVGDMKGMRLRAASRTIVEFIKELGGTPRGLPPTQMVEQMEKGTLDGAFIDYGGAGIAFRLGPVTKYTTEMYSYVTSFGVGFNPRSFAALPKKYQDMIVNSFVGVEKEVGHEWDKLDAIGKAIMVKAGDTPIVLTAEEKAKFKAAGDRVTERWLTQLEKDGKPARAVYKMMQDLAAKHAKDSKNFLQ
jgi:TRAP-type C4-dicarboxylate transport system substrate-binding protein